VPLQELKNFFYLGSRRNERGRPSECLYEMSLKKRCQASCCIFFHLRHLPKSCLGITSPTLPPTFIQSRRRNYNLSLTGPEVECSSGKSGVRVAKPGSASGRLPGKGGADKRPPAGGRGKGMLGKNCEI